MTTREWLPMISCGAVLMILCVAVQGGDLQETSIAWHSIDGGGGVSAGGPFTVAGTVGQPDAGTMSGGHFSLSGGFWNSSAGGATPGDCDDDGDVDLIDYACFIDCLTGPGGGLLSGCDPFDTDVDGDVDLHDFGAFTRHFTGS